MFLREKKAQPILEYLIVLTAIITGFILAKDALKRNASQSLEKIATEAEDVVSRMEFVK